MNRRKGIQRNESPKVGLSTRNKVEILSSEVLHRRAVGKWKKERKELFPPPFLGQIAAGRHPGNGKKGRKRGGKKDLKRRKNRTSRIRGKRPELEKPLHQLGIKSATRAAYEEVAEKS